jgi:Fe2+ transport system protein FeoA
VRKKIKFIMKKITLADASLNKKYKIYEIKISDKFIQSHLKNLGFEIGENIQLLKHNYKKFGFMVKVMGVNFVVDKRVAEMIFVYES